MSNHVLVLNEKGRQLYGSIFPEGCVPVTSFKTENGILDAGTKPEDFYKVPLDLLSKEQLDNLVELVARSCNISMMRVRLSFNQLGFIPFKAAVIIPPAADEGLELLEGVET